MICLSGVSLQLNSREILDSVNLKIPRGEAHAIIGPSGSGKSVILKVIAGLLPPSSGQIEVQSQKLSMVFQKNALFDSMTLLDNLLVPLSETRGISGDEAENRGMNLLRAVGLDQAAHQYPDEISGGMQKRLGIARALIIDPEVILYDEPTAGLDPVTSSSIAELINRLRHENQTTLVMVTNDLQRAYQVSDQISFCSGGRLRAIGTPTGVKATQDAEVREFIYSSALTRIPHGGPP